MIPQDESILGQPIFQNPGAPVFNPNQAANMEYVYGTSIQRQASMPQRQITPQGDVVTARIEGYKK